jgi:hypothetical protein
MLSGRRFLRVGMLCSRQAPGPVQLPERRAGQCELSERGGILLESESRGLRRAAGE